MARISDRQPDRNVLAAVAFNTLGIVMVSVAGSMRPGVPYVLALVVAAVLSLGGIALAVRSTVKAPSVASPSRGCSRQPPEP